MVDGGEASIFLWFRNGIHKIYGPEHTLTAISIGDLLLLPQETEHTAPHALRRFDKPMAEFQQIITIIQH